MGIAKKILASVYTRPGFGPRIILPQDPSDVWYVVEVSARQDCYGLAKIAAYQLAQIGIEAAYAVSWPVLGGIDGTNATRSTIRALPQEFQDHPTPGITLYYTLVYYDDVPSSNGYEGYFWVVDEERKRLGFTVAPAHGPISPTVSCPADPLVDPNDLAYNIINKTLLTFSGTDNPGPGKLFWRDQNSHINKAPQIGPLTFPRNGCDAGDLVAAPKIE